MPSSKRSRERRSVHQTQGGSIADVARGWVAKRAAKGRQAREERSPACGPADLPRAGRPGEHLRRERPTRASRAEKAPPGHGERSPERKHDRSDRPVFAGRADRRPPRASGPCHVGERCEASEVVPGRDAPPREHGGGRSRSPKERPEADGPCENDQGDLPQFMVGGLAYSPSAAP
jgi:hypothetical protein